MSRIANIVAVTSSLGLATIIGLAENSNANIKNKVVNCMSGQQAVSMEKDAPFMIDVLDRFAFFKHAADTRCYGLNRVDGPASPRIYQETQDTSGQADRLAAGERPPVAAQKYSSDATQAEAKPAKSHKAGTSKKTAHPAAKTGHPVSKSAPKSEEARENERLQGELSSDGDGTTEIKKTYSKHDRRALDGLLDSTSRKSSSIQVPRKFAAIDTTKPIEALRTIAAIDAREPMQIANTTLKVVRTIAHA